MSSLPARSRKPALVLLAAGESRRLGQCKALVAITPRNPLELLASAGACLDDGPPLVVTGAHHVEIAARLPSGMEIVHNARWRGSRSAGVIAAAAVRPERDLCVAPVDTPLVPREVFEQLLAAWRAHGSPARGWLAPACSAPDDPEKSSYGHPIVVGRELVKLLDAMPETTPLSALRAHALPLFSVAVESRAILDDLDTPEDLARLRARGAI